MTQEQSDLPQGRKVAYKTVLDTPFPPQPRDWPKLKDDAKLDETSFYDALSKLLLTFLKPIGDQRRLEHASRAPKRRRGRQDRQLTKVLSPAPLPSAEVQALGRCLVVGLKATTDALQLECRRMALKPLLHGRVLQKRDACTLHDIGSGRSKLKNKRKAELTKSTEEMNPVPRKLSVVLVCQEESMANCFVSRFPELCSTTVARRVAENHADCALYLVALPVAVLVDVASALGLPRVAAVGLTAVSSKNAVVDAQLKNLFTLLELNLEPVLAATALPVPNKDNVAYVPTKLRHIETTAPIMKRKQGAKVLSQ